MLYQWAEDVALQDWTRDTEIWASSAAGFHSIPHNRDGPHGVKTLGITEPWTVFYDEDYRRCSIHRQARRPDSGPSSTSHSCHSTNLVQEDI